MITTTKKHTYLDYEKLPEGAPYQLIDGELVMTPAPTFDHQDIVAELTSQLRNFIKQRNLGKAVSSPIDVYLGETEVYQPDIVFVSKERLHIIVEGRIKGAPDLVMEVLSPSNAYYDLVRKKNLYESAGVREYWIVDPQERTIEVYENVDGRFQLYAKAKQQGSIGSKLLEGFKIEWNDLT